MATFAKNAALGGLAFGIGMGLFLGFRVGDYVVGVVAGLATGVGFGVVLGAFARYQTGKFTAQDPTAPGEQLLKQGAANHFRMGESVGGFLYLSDSRLLFRSHRYNIQKHEQSIPLTVVRDVQPCMTLLVVPNGIRVVTADGVERFVVEDRKSWINAILAAAR